MNYSGKHQPPPRQTLIYGKPIRAALDDALTSLAATRVALVSSSSLMVSSGPGGLASQVQQALGKRYLATITGPGAHTPRRDVIRIAASLHDSGADAVVALGGGSVCDGVKAARLCLGNNVTQAADMDRLRMGLGKPVQAPSLGFVMIPTTLSAAEFSPFAGVVDERVPRKEGYTHEHLTPSTVVLDATMTQATPARLWFSTAIRAIDHAVEALCSRNPSPYSDAMSLQALRLLGPALRRLAESTNDLDARLQCQIGAWLSIQGFVCGVEFGVSHGIGHALGGTAGMPHGETSCVMLPHALHFNAPVNAARQALLSETMGRPGIAAGDVIGDLVAALGMPTRLRDAGVSREILQKVADEASVDHCTKTNPRPIESVDQILELLEQAW